jgi:hypothetical protein
VDTNGANGWLIPVPTAALPGGTHTYFAQATDAVGLVGAPASTSGAVTSTSAPAVVSSAFDFHYAPHRLSFTFNQDVSASLTLEDFVVRAQPSGQTITPVGLSYNVLTNTATVTFEGVLADSNYRATLARAGVLSNGGTPMAADHVLDFYFMRGDASRDGRVNLADFNILAGNFGLSGQDFTEGDFNYDRTVNLQDFNLLAGRFGTTLAPAATTTGGRGSVVRDEEAEGLLDLLDELK